MQFSASQIFIRPELDRRPMGPEQTLFELAPFEQAPGWRLTQLRDFDGARLRAGDKASSLN